jgi:hypothetical protein
MARAPRPASTNRQEGGPPPSQGAIAEGQGDIPSGGESNYGGTFPTTGGSTPHRTRPVQVAGHYPERHVTWYQVSTSDARLLGIAQAVTTVFASLGTFALSQYLEIWRDSAASNQLLSTFVSNLMFYGWLVFWVIAGGAFVWRQSEWERIRREHGEPSLPNRIRNWWRS